jgi:hypothetical protein
VVSFAKTAEVTDLKPEIGMICDLLNVVNFLGCLCNSFVKAVFT